MWFKPHGSLIKGGAVMAEKEDRELTNLDVAILALVTSGDENSSAQAEFMQSLLMKVVGMKDRAKVLDALKRSKERLAYLQGKIEDLEKLFKEQKAPEKAAS